MNRYVRSLIDIKGDYVSGKPICIFPFNLIHLWHIDSIIRLQMCFEHFRYSYNRRVVAIAINSGRVSASVFNTYNVS